MKSTGDHWLVAGRRWHWRDLASPPIPSLHQTHLTDRLGTGKHQFSWFVLYFPWVTNGILKTKFKIIEKTSSQIWWKHKRILQEQCQWLEISNKGGKLGKKLALQQCNSYSVHTCYGMGNTGVINVHSLLNKPLKINIISDTLHNLLDSLCCCCCKM